MREDEDLLGGFDKAVTELKLTDEEEARRVPTEDFGIEAPKGLTLLR